MNLQDAVQASTSSKSPIQDASRFCLSSVNTKARLTTLCALDSPDMMEVKALELSMKNKSTKSKSKRKKKVDGRARADGTKTETKKLPKAPLTGPEGRKRRQQQLSQQERPKNEAVGVETVVHGTERVVSFLDKKDLERQRKREKRIEIQSKRKLAQSQARKKKS